MKRWTWLVLAALTPFTVPLSAQQIVVGDTIEITIQGNVDQVVLTAEYVTPPRVGDTIFFRALVTDEDGDPINALIRFGVEDPTVIRLEAISDSTLASNEGLARGIALRKATTRVWVGANPVSEMRLASFRPPDSLNWAGFDTLYLKWLESPGDSTWSESGERWVYDYILGPSDPLQYCAYLTRGETLVAEDPGPPACPTVFYPDPTGPYLPRLAWYPFPGEFRRVARGLPVNPNQSPKKQEPEGY
jgi:hypothetical protein